MKKTPRPSRIDDFMTAGEIKEQGLEDAPIKNMTWQKYLERTRRKGRHGLKSYDGYGRETTDAT